jgi:hypothetical protein
MKVRKLAEFAAVFLAAITLTTPVSAQPRGPRGLVVVSPEIKPDRHVAFRLPAPKAEAVGMFTTDMPGGFAPRPLKKALDDDAKTRLKLLWFATGKEDFLLARTKETVELFKKHGFSPVFKETDGGHTWINWQRYLSEFAPQLFR